MPITEPGQPRTRFIDHRGTQILLLDYSDIMDVAEALAAIAETKAIISRQPLASVRTLTYVRGARVTADVVEALKDLAAHDKPYVKAAAIVGLSTLQRIVFRAITAVVRRHIHVMDDLSEAKDWLAEQ